MRLHLSILLFLLLQFPVFGQMAPVTVTPDYVNFEPFPPLGKSYRVYEYTFKLSKTGKDTLKDVKRSHLINPYGNIIETYLWNPKRSGQKTYLYKQTFSYGDNRQINFETMIEVKPALKRTPTRANLSSFKQIIKASNWLDTIYGIKSEFYQNGLKRKAYLDRKNRDPITFTDTIPYTTTKDGTTLTSGFYDESNLYRMTDSFQVIGDTTWHWQRRAFGWKRSDAKWGTYYISKKVYHKERNTYLLHEGFNSTISTAKYTYNKSGYPIFQENTGLSGSFVHYHYDQNGLLERKEYYYRTKLYEVTYFDYEF